MLPVAVPQYFGTHFFDHLSLLTSCASLPGNVAAPNTRASTQSTAVVEIAKELLSSRSCNAVQTKAGCDHELGHAHRLHRDSHAGCSLSTAWTVHVSRVTHLASTPARHVTD